MITIFDSKEIASRALLRAGEIKAEKALVRKRIKTAGTLSAMCMAVVILVTVTFNQPSEHIVIDSDAVPLAATPVDADSSYAGFNLAGYESFTISSDSMDIDIPLYNPEGNPYWLSFEIILTDYNETLYISDILEPSGSIKSVKLTRSLDKGEYAATLIIHAYENAGLTEVSKESTPFTIISA